MALVVGDPIPAIPSVAAFLPNTNRRTGAKLRPCGTAAARRRHFLRREPQDDLCREWHRKDMARRREARRASRHRNLWHKPVTLVAGDLDLFDIYPMEEVA